MTTVNEINLLKIAYRNVFISISETNVRNLLQNNQAFQKVFLSQLSIYNFLFDAVKENKDTSNLAENPSVQSSNESSTNEQLDNFCFQTNFSLSVNNSLTFLDRFNQISHCQCVVKDLVVRSINIDDIQDDLNYFSVFLKNSISVDINALNPVTLKKNFDAPVITPATYAGIDENESLPSAAEFAQMSRKNWIDFHANYKFMREIVENKIYLFTSKPKSVLVLKCVALFVLGLANLVNIALCLLFLYLAFVNNDANVIKSAQTEVFLVIPVSSLTTYFFCREMQTIFMSIKGNGVSAPLISFREVYSSAQNVKQKIFNNDNIKFYFNWKPICFSSVFSVFFLAYAVKSLLNSGLNNPINVVDFSIAIAYIAAYALIGAVIIAALFINPKADVQRISNRKYEIFRELSDQIDDGSLSSKT